MRGDNDIQSGMFSYFSPEQRVPAEHPLRAIKTHADAALQELSPVFNSMYSKMGRPSIPPERLLKSQLLIALYSVRSETQFCQQVDYNILFRWFLDMNLEEPSFDPTTFTKNRDRLLEHQVAVKFFDRVVNIARKDGLLSDDHFTVDGTLIEACASLKSFRPKDEDPSDRPTTDNDPGNPTVNFRGEKRKNETHVSTTDPESRLMKKSAGKEAKLSFGAHALMENRNGLLVDIIVTPATGITEGEAAQEMLTRQARKRVKPKTIGADKGYDTADFVQAMRKRTITPHVAANTGRKGGSAIDGRTTRHEGYNVSQRIRKRVEEVFGWLKTIGGFRRTRYKGRDRTHLQAWFVGAAYNLMRIANIQRRIAAAT
jgi:transposase